MSRGRGAAARTRPLLLGPCSGVEGGVQRRPAKGTMSPLVKLDFCRESVEMCTTCKDLFLHVD